MSNKINLKDITNKLTEKYANSSWKDFLLNEINSVDFAIILNRLISDKEEGILFTPSLKQLFRPFELCIDENLTTVIINNYPFQVSEQNDGLALSGNNEVSKFVSDEITRNIPFGDSSGSLDKGYLVSQGILFYNAALTCEVGNQEAHKDLWMNFTKNFMSYLAKHHTGLNFVFVGDPNMEFVKLVASNNNKYFVSYPSKDWDTNNIFVKINDIVKQVYDREIVW